MSPRPLLLGAIPAGLLLASCAGRPAGTLAPSAIPTVAAALTAEVVAPTLRPNPTPDLTAHPLVWFAPLPPLEVNASRPFIGAEDYMDLFRAGAPWQEALRRIDVFEVYGGWAAYAPWTIYASDEELARVIEFVNQNGLALAMEDSPIQRHTECCAGFESWGGLSLSLETARRIKRFGGTLNFIVMDAPYYYTSLIDYPGACQWPAAQVAGEIDAYTRGMQTVFPDLVIGDAEPLQAYMSPATYRDWLRTFQEVTGYNLAFLHMDLDHARPDWAERVKELEDFAREQGIDFGIFYFGNWDDLTDEAWLSSAGERVKRYELEIGGRPDHVLFQSWHDHPDRTLPETEPYTYTHFINQYFEDKAGLGFRREGAGANVAFGKSARASRSRPDQPPTNAVDGNPGTVWGAGDFPPNWVEIDLGAEYTIGEIRLRLDQGQLIGLTTHRVYVKGTATNGQLVLLHTFEGETSNLDQLVYVLPEPLEGIQFVRAEITRSPSWVAFREIEVIAAK